MNEMAEIISLEMGAPITLSRVAQAPAGLRHLKESIERVGAFQVRGDQRFHVDAKRARGSVRADNAVELAHESNRLQSGAGSSDRLHHGSQAQRICADVSEPVRTDFGSSRSASWRFQYGDWRRAYGRSRYLISSRHRNGLFHRFHACGSRCGISGSTQREASRAGIGRKIGLHNPQRRRFTSRGKRLCAERLPEHRSILQRADANACPGFEECRRDCCSKGSRRQHQSR